MIEKTCIGCSLANKQQNVYVIYENDVLTCILDIEPFNQGHTLILPKMHALDVDELDSITASSIMETSILISKAFKELYQPDGITICQNGGIFNDLTHYHMHVIPRYKDQNFADFFGESSPPNTTIDLTETCEKLKAVIKQLTTRQS